MPQPTTFHQQLEAARIRLGLPTTATAYEIMCANATHEAQTGEMWRAMWDDVRANGGKLYFSKIED